jgi:FdhD protein
MPRSDEAGAVAVRAREYRYDDGAVGPAATRDVAVETPVNLLFGGVPFAVMIATPADLEDFAVGFALTEGIVERPKEIRAIEVERADNGFKLDIALAGERMAAHLARGRVLSGRTGCGLCGIQDLAQLPAPQKRLAGAKPIVLLREDVGRHNALDKLIGALARSGVSPEDGFIAITSRCSFEMVAKAAAFGASTLVALSAPTSLAIERAQACGLTLIAVARPDHATIFAGPAFDKELAA